MGVRKGQVSVGVGGLLISPFGYAKRRISGDDEQGRKIFRPYMVGASKSCGALRILRFPPSTGSRTGTLDERGEGESGRYRGSGGCAGGLGRMVEIPAGAGMTGWARERSPVGRRCPHQRGWSPPPRNRAAWDGISDRTNRRLRHISLAKKGPQDQIRLLG